ncbi:MAG TPA: peptidoglycan editing factor PgeF [Desulfobacterales bacterium]|nr:peptidoglycan editing factor PgeF [Desulfobacterales bacterium]
MIQKKIDSLTLWFFENLLTHKRIGHFVSTRVSGRSDPPYHSLNLSFNVGDDPDKVLKNRKLLAGALGIPLASVTTAKQIHDGHVKVVSEALRGRGSTNYQGAVNATDAMVTDTENTCLMILLADCVPILFYDPSKRVIGAAHAGWRGTLRFVAHNTVKVFREDFGCSPEDIVVGIGPSIGPCCYQVGQDVVSQVQHVLGARQHCISLKSANGKGYFDLWTANLKQLIQAGIPEKNIELAKICTRHHPEVFFSHRHEKRKTGRFGAGIVILPSSSHTT